MKERSIMGVVSPLTLPEAPLIEICRRYGVWELSVFGSAARGDMRPDSDIDLLVDFLPEARPGLLGLAAMTREFRSLLGCRVDVAVKPALKPLVRNEVLREARVIYEA